MLKFITGLFGMANKENENTTVLPTLQTNAGEMRVSKEPLGGDRLVEREPISESPFTLVTKLTEAGANCFIAIGSDQVTEMITRDEALERLEKGSWKLIWNMAVKAAMAVRHEEKMERVKQMEEDRKTMGIHEHADKYPEDMIVTEEDIRKRIDELNNMK